MDPYVNEYIVVTQIEKEIKTYTVYAVKFFHVERHIVFVDGEDNNVAMFFVQDVRAIVPRLRTRVNIYKDAWDRYSKNYSNER